MAKLIPLGRWKGEVHQDGLYHLRDGGLVIRQGNYYAVAPGTWQAPEQTRVYSSVPHEKHWTRCHRPRRASQRRGKARFIASLLVGAAGWGYLAIARNPFGMEGTYDFPAHVQRVERADGRPVPYGQVVAPSGIYEAVAGWSPPGGSPHVTAEGPCFGYGRKTEMTRCRIIMRESDIDELGITVIPFEKYLEP